MGWIRWSWCGGYPNWLPVRHISVHMRVHMCVCVCECVYVCKEQKHELFICELVVLTVAAGGLGRKCFTWFEWGNNAYNGTRLIKISRLLTLWNVDSWLLVLRAKDKQLVDWRNAWSGKWNERSLHFGAAILQYDANVDFLDKIVQ